jgi:hypothetical protein
MPSSVELVCVDPARVAEIWPHARALIRAAIDHTGLSDFADIEANVLSGDQLLWLAWGGKSIEAAATTQLIAVRAHKVCVLTACAGQNRARWLPLFEQIEAFARNEGCLCMRIYGRKGWERVLSSYRVEHVILEKVL